MKFLTTNKLIFVLLLTFCFIASVTQAFGIDRGKGLGNPSCVDLGVNTSPMWMAVYGTDLAINGVPIEPGDTLFAYFQDCLVGARIFDSCFAELLEQGFCQYNILKFMPIYYKDIYDPIGGCGPLAGDFISFKLGTKNAVNRLSITTDPIIHWSSLGDHVKLNSFSINNCCTLRGDFNNDGSISIVDLIGMTNYMFKNGTAPVCTTNLDVDANEALDICDVIYFVKYITNQGPAPIKCAE